MNSPITKESLNKVQGAAAFSKGIAILQMIADSTQPPTIPELVKASGLPRPTLYRLLKALAAEDLVHARHNKTFAVGTRLIQLAGRALEQNDLVRIAEPELDRLCELTEETVHLAIRSGNSVVYIMNRESPKAVRIASNVGGNLPLHSSAIGKSILANLPEDQREEIIDSLEMKQYTKFTSTDKDQLRMDLVGIRENMFATSHQETQLEVQCFASSIFDQQGMPVAGIGVSVPIYRISDRPQTSYVKPLLACCGRITRQLGGEDVS